MVVTALDGALTTLESQLQEHTLCRANVYTELGLRLPTLHEDVAADCMFAHPVYRVFGTSVSGAVDMAGVWDEVLFNK